MADPGQRSTARKIEIFRSCFSGMDHVYGTYDPESGRYRQVKEPVTDNVLLQHLTGIRPYGVYLLQASRTRAAVVDFDSDDRNPPLQFVLQARHYGVLAYIERSKSKGWHVWVFFPAAGVDAAKARRVLRIILSDIEMPRTEVFPKQDKLGGNATNGNCINVPLFGKLSSQGRTVFVDPSNGFAPYPDQWSVLEHVERIPESLLDQILEINGADYPDVTPAPEAGPPGDVAPATFGLPPCAQRMLADGVTENQRIACFRLAVQLKKAGIPRYGAIACLMEWAGRNHPENGKTIITPEEVVQQANWAYAHSYRGCGCEDEAVKPFCSAACPLRNRPHSGHPGSEDEQAVGHQNARMSNDK